MAARAAAGRDEVGDLSEALRAEIEEAIQKRTANFNGRTDFGNASAVFLAEKLRGNTTVEVLGLHRCWISAVGARALAKMLAEENSTLKSLNICSNPLGDDGAEAMALMLRKNQSLEDLNLGACGVGDQGARALGEALKENPTLKRLDLSSNHVSNDVTRALAEALRWNESLENLSLVGLQLTDAGVSSLLAALRESNSTLTHLWLSGNHGIKDFKIRDSIRELFDENKAAPATAERRARCLLFCCLKLAPTAHEHVVPSIGAVPVPVMQYAVEHAGKMHVAERFEHGNVVAGLSSAGVRARSSSSSDFSADSETATSRRR